MSMVKYTIHIEPTIDEVSKNIVEDYWKSTDKNFTHSVKDLSKKYNLRQSQITKLVETSSYGFSSKRCCDCKCPIEQRIYCRAHITNFIICEVCKKVRQKNLDDLEQQSDHDDYLYLKKEMENFYSDSPPLPDLMEKPIDDLKANNNFSCSLIKKNNKSKPTSPDYSGAFILPTDVVLKAGKKYIYGGWIQSDNSISLKVTLQSELKIVMQTKIGEEPKSIKDILFKN